MPGTYFFCKLVANSMYMYISIAAGIMYVTVKVV